MKYSVSYYVPHSTFSDISPPKQPVLQGDSNFLIHGLPSDNWYRFIMIFAVHTSEYPIVLFICMLLPVADMYLTCTVKLMLLIGLSSICALKQEVCFVICGDLLKNHIQIANIVFPVSLNIKHTWVLSERGGMCCIVLITFEPLQHLLRETFVSFP